MPKRLNINSLTVTRLLCQCRRHLTTTPVAPRYLRPFTVSALDTNRLAMDKSRKQIYAQWSQTELISRILELERSMET